LMRSPTLSEYVYRLARWLGKELPIATFKLLKREAQGVDLLQTPIGLICAHARAAGQAQAQLPTAAKEIVWMESLPPVPVLNSLNQQLR
jgi:hypothetical protein